MNREIIDQALKMIDGELMKAPINGDEMEGLRKEFLLRVLFIEQAQTHMFRVA